MIVIKGNKEHPLFKSIQNKLDSLRVSYDVLPSSNDPFIQDGKRIVKGENEIDVFLLELEKELAYWYYCSV